MGLLVTGEDAAHHVALRASVLTEGFACQAAGQVHCGMVGLLSVGSKMQGRVWLEILLVVVGWFVAIDFSLVFLPH